MKEGEVFVAHTHPVFASDVSHFRNDIPNAGKHVEGVVDFSGHLIFFDKTGVLNPKSKASGTKIDPMPLEFHSGFLDADGNIVGYASVKIIANSNGEVSMKVIGN